MKNIKQLLTSKRFGVAVAGVLFVIFNEHMGLDLDMASIVSVVGLAIGFIVSQGSADKGKEAAKINKGEIASLTETIERIRAKSDPEEVEDWIDVFPPEKDVRDHEEERLSTRVAKAEAIYQKLMGDPRPPKDDDDR